MRRNKQTNNKNRHFRVKHRKFAYLIPPVTVMFLTYATSSMKTVWRGGDETVFLSLLIKTSK